MYGRFKCSFNILSMPLLLVFFKFLTAAIISMSVNGLLILVFRLVWFALLEKSLVFVWKFEFSICWSSFKDLKYL